MKETIEMIAVGMLEGHPYAAAFWPDSVNRREDVETICSDVAETRRIKEPLEVCFKHGTSGYWVIDGCTRLMAAVAAGMESVPCRVVEISESNIPNEVYLSNMTRTRFGTGMRVMRYLEMHADAVIAVSEKNEDIKSRGLVGRTGKLGSNDPSFNAEAISERLKVSDKDVKKGIELLRCRVGEKKVCLNEGTRKLVPLENERERDDLEAAYLSVLAGKTPLRRWVAAKAGRTATENTGKAPTDYANLAERTAVSLQNVFEHWGEAKWESKGQREKVENGLAAALAIMPECCKQALMELIPQSWGPHEKQTLAKSISKK